MLQKRKPKPVPLLKEFTKNATSLQLQNLGGLSELCQFYQIDNEVNNYIKRNFKNVDFVTQKQIINNQKIKLNIVYSRKLLRWCDYDNHNKRISFHSKTYDQQQLAETYAKIEKHMLVVCNAIIAERILSYPYHINITIRKYNQTPKPHTIPIQPSTIYEMPG